MDSAALSPPRSLVSRPSLAAVVVALMCLVPLAAWAAAGGGPVSAAGADAVFSRLPAGQRALAATDAAGPRGVVLEVNAAALRAFRSAGGGRVALPVQDGQSLVLELAPFEILAPGARVTCTGRGGPVPMAVDLGLFRGEVAGEAGSWAVLSLSRQGVLGVINRAAGQLVLAPLGVPGAEGAQALHAVSDVRDLPGPSTPFTCGTDEQANLVRALPPIDGASRRSVESANRLYCDLAYDCDYEFFANKEGGDSTRAANYVLTLAGIISTIYERDVNVALRVSYLNLWTTPADPYTATTMQTELDEFTAWWNSNRGDVPRHIAHLVSGRSLGGGVAWLNVLCDPSQAYSLGQVDGYYTYPTPTVTWDVEVQAHEIGHNFGSYHTHNCYWQAAGFIPAGALIDSCYGAEGGCYSGPTGILPPNKGTIMSYCHQVAGVANGIRLDFHPACATVMRTASETCLLQGDFDAHIDLAAGASGHDVQLDWNPSPVPDVIRYDVYRSGVWRDPNPALAGSTATTSFVDVGRIGVCYYRVRAVRASDQSFYSNEARVSVCLSESTPFFPAGNSTLSPVTADFNEDGIPDLAVANALSTGTVSVLLGQGTGGVGNGSFAAPVAFAAGITPSAMVEGDFNEDGILDLAVTNKSNSGTCSILLGGGAGGIGNGTFLAPASFAVGVRPSAVVTADFNEDGILDLAVANNGNNSLSVALGQGSGGVGNGLFAPVVNYGTSTRPVSIATGDFNADGITDLAVACNGTGAVSVLLGLGTGGAGDGTFAPAVSYTAGGAANSIATGDFDEDGITDLAVVLNLPTGAVAILRGLGSAGVGNGTFAAAVTFAAGTSPTWGTTGDFNGDGIADIVVSNQGNNVVSYLLGVNAGGAGHGSFDVFLSVDVGLQPVGMALGDFNEDGRPDLAVAHAASANNVAILSDLCPAGQPAYLAVLTPNGGEHWAGHSEKVIAWTRGRAIVAVNIEVSRDNGQRWETIARGLTGSSFTWTVTGPPTDSASALIRIHDPSVPSRSDESDAGFVIAPDVRLEAPVTPQAALALEAACPSPARSGLRISFSLPGGEPATLELMDITGRRVRGLAVGTMGPGRHSVEFGRGDALPSGVYFIRLSQGGRRVIAKAVVLN